ncbi:MAG: hypothetical protein IJK45_01255 [Bacteroidaceae bacterium]|nr:hypothetical protein [Bacteroidaceae bacterium]
MATTKVRCADDSALYEDIDFCMGNKSLPGTRNHGYYVPRRDIVTFPRPAGSSAETMEDVAVIKSNILLAADKQWKRFDLVPNESEPTSESQGSYGSKTMLNKITLVLPGTGKKATGFISQLNNDDVVFLIPMADGKCRLFGSPLYQAEISVSQAFGKASTDANTTTVEVSVTDEFAAPFYEGEFTTSEGTFLGTTDELKPENP